MSRVMTSLGPMPLAAITPTNSCKKAHLGIAPTCAGATEALTVVRLNTDFLVHRAMTDLPAAQLAPKPHFKRLALFLDGTWNEEGDNTNVWRLRSLTAKISQSQQPQLIYYNSGVGTRVFEKARGGLFGFGLDRNIKDAYEWLVENYETDDQIFIFGFSRGAFTARSLAGFITKCGILRPGAPLGVAELFQRYRTAPDTRTIRNMTGKPAAELSLQESWLLKFAHVADVTMVGVWDTVGSLGIPFGKLSGISRSSFGFLSTGLYQSQKHAYQAIALDEHRPDFTPTLWTKHVYSDGRPTAAPRLLADVEQRWFVGAHANVGGGYATDPLPQTPLRWLMGKASQLGLEFREQVEPDPTSLPHPVADSYGGFLGGTYRFLPGRTSPYNRPIGVAPVRDGAAVSEVINETIDGSVFGKWRADVAYRPRNLTAWAQTHGLQPETLNGPISATDASPVPP